MRGMTLRYQALRGTKDILPDEVELWQKLEDACRRIFHRYGFREIRTPIFEATDLFARSVGDGTDIVRKEMYTFSAGDESVTLRPENTAPVVRAFVEHAMHRRIAHGFPERLYYLGPMFRYERPQKGRQRQFHQFGVEVLGGAEPQIDAETIEMVGSLLDELGVSHRSLHVNSVGDGDTRHRYRLALTSWLQPRLPAMCEDCRRRAVENPLRVFDCKVDADRTTLEQAPKALDFLSVEAGEHFAAVCSALDDYAIAYVVDPRLVRGLDYYQRTVFEITAGGLGAQNAIVGGGRYDGLVEQLGGPAVPGFGFAAGMERVIMAMREGAGIGDGRPAAPETDLAIIALGAAGFSKAGILARALRRQGLSVSVPTIERSLGAQMKRLERSGPRFALFVGEGEIARGRFGLKDLATGEQVEVDEAGIRAAVREGRRSDGR